MPCQTTHRRQTRAPPFCSLCRFAPHNSGMIEFDEFLDIMWDVKHAKGSARGLLFGRAGVFLEGTLAAAQAALQSKRQQMRTPGSSASGLGGLFSQAQGAKADETTSLTSHGSQSHATDSMGSSIASAEQREEQEPVVLQKRQMAVTTTPLSAAMARGKEAAICILPKLAGKTMKWRGFSRPR